jgi:hypothetical protein
VDRFKDTLISTTLVGGRTVVHVHGDSPPDDTFQPVEPDLKDVYFTVMRGFSIHRPEPEPMPEDVAGDDSGPTPPYFSRPPSQDSAPDSAAPPSDVAPPVETTPPPLRDPAPNASNDIASPSPDDSAPPSNDPSSPPEDGAPAKEEDPWALFRRPGSSA